jgi:hypothetical protein
MGQARKERRSAKRGGSLEERAERMIMGIDNADQVSKPCRRHEAHLYTLHRWEKRSREGGLRTAETTSRITCTVAHRRIVPNLYLEGPNQN